MGYRVVEDYYRKEIFEFFRTYRDPFYSISFKLQFSRLKALLDARGWKTYLNLCYFFIRAATPLEDFRYALVDGRIVLYDALHLGLTLPAAGGLFGFASLDYVPDAERFNAEAALPGPDDPPRLGPEDPEKKYAFFTAIPGIPFQSFAHATNDREDSSPRVAFGKPYTESGELWVPVGIQVNHVFVDGRALGELYERLVAVFENPER